MTSNKKYIEDIANEQLLSDKEEQELAEKIKVGDVRALEKLTKANLKFVISLAHQYRNRGLDEDDLISEGNIGMMYAAQNSINFLRTRQVDLNRSVHKLSLLISLYLSVVTITSHFSISLRMRMPSMLTNILTKKSSVTKFKKD